ncbi:TlpA disulfide reductase family protein [uncultured Chryseobacterium sp.]|uniref:TlpA family protein disulfide reductase n=1 Tax=uncultured Chryseobacterium sp. TaxID=259322 RepID=UPI0025EB5ECE|nr:TlpA disulfide reductase family protein [uncultured Chryseobacterium sp.]
MKKIILSTAMLVALSGCKKETKTAEADPAAPAADSMAVENNTERAASYASKEVAPENMGQYLAQKNDTLYVTNFFATWCGPCMKEIPHFKKKIEELKGQPVKFTFVDMDDSSEWNGAVKKFGEENGLTDHIILLDGKKLDKNFFPNNFQKWDGGSIPFTYMRKGDKTDEYLGNMSEDELTSKINTMLTK